MHTATFKTFVDNGKSEAAELNVEYIPESDLVIFSINGHEVFSANYSQSLEGVIESLATVAQLSRA